MGIMTRVVRIFKADVHGVMDQLEDRELLLKQHLRDMAQALSLKEVKLGKMHASRKQIQREYEKYRQQSQALEQDLAIAIQKNKDDIARMLIRKIKPLERLQEEVADRIRNLDEEISYSRERLEQQQIHYERLKHRSVEFFNNPPMQKGCSDLSATDCGAEAGDMTDAEIDWELLKRKEAMGMASH